MGLRNPKLRQYTSPESTLNSETAILDMHQVQRLVQQSTPYQYRRKLRYRGDHGELRIAEGSQIVSVTPVGATIYPDGPNSMQQRVIPWPRIWDFDFDPTDPIMQWNR